MAKSTTEQKVRSIEDKIIGDINSKAFFSICDEYKISESCTKNLLEIRDDPKTPLSVKVHINMWFIDKMVPDPKQSIDMGGDVELKITREIINEPKD